MESSMHLFRKDADEDFAKVEVNNGMFTILRVKSVYLHDNGTYIIACKGGDVHTFPATSEISINPGRG
tara:strand:+ start:1689 stop:1892 length:204 start_codon:yes stop_codon:yes gene_type:complete